MLTLCKDYNVPKLASARFYCKITRYVDKGATQIYWERPFVTGWCPITANKLDLVVVDYQNRLMLLIDISISGNWNVGTKENGKLEKYSERRTEIRHMWGIDVKTIPVVIGALGTDKRSLLTFLNLIWAKARVEIIQRESVSGTLHQLHRVLDIHWLTCMYVRIAFLLFYTYYIPLLCSYPFELG